MNDCEMGQPFARRLERIRQDPAMWRHPLDAIPANVAILDADGVILDVNSRWRCFGRANGLACDDVGRGCNYLSLCREAARQGDDLAAAVEGLEKILGGTSSGFNLEYPCHSPTVQRWFTCLAAPLPMGSDRLGAVVMHIDITARRLAEERLARLNQARYDFICALAHEIRSPLQAVTGFTDLLLTRTTDSTSVEYLRLIAQSCHHILDVVTGVLDLTKAAAGHFALDDERVSPVQIADFAASTLSGLAETEQVRIERVDEPEVDGLYVRADARLLRQAVLNVLANAIKFSPPGATVRVAVERLPDGAIILSVADRGRGISASELERILLPFIQGSALGSAGEAETGQTTARTTGTGLGLPLAREFLRLHGCDLFLQSLPGEGTTVTLMLPPERVLAPRQV